MAIVVEDGTGLANAVAYDSVANVSAYHAARGRTDWAALSTPNMEAAIVRATDYIDARFGRRFRGDRAKQEQALEWPRWVAYDDDGYLLVGSDVVPRQIKRAMAEYALISARFGELAPTPPSPVGSQAVATGVVTGPSRDPGVVIERKNIVGPIDSSVRYADPGSRVTKRSTSSLVSAFNIPEYPIADMWLEELLRSRLSGDIGRA